MGTHRRLALLEEEGMRRQDELLDGAEQLRIQELVAPQGFEPRYAAPEAAVLPLNEGAMRQTRSRQIHPAFLY
jgi:hypothetical protein